MTHHQTGPQQQREHHGHHGERGQGAAQARVLDLDADMMLGHTRSLLSSLPIADAPTQIADLGAGTGAGTLELLRAFPTASLVAVDSSVEHLDLLRARCGFEGFDDRVRVEVVDLDAPSWPDLGAPDLVWASASLHHLADPEETLLRVQSLMQIDGLLVVVELDGMPRFLASTDDGSAGLEQRCYEAVQPTVAAQMPHRGADWGTTLSRCGYAVEERRILDLAITGADNPAVAPYAAAALSGLRAVAAPHLSPDDLKGLDQLLDPTDTRSVWNRLDLIANATRSVWIARRTGGPTK